MGFIADEFNGSPRGPGEDDRAVPTKAPPPRRALDAMDGAVRAAAIVFLGQLRQLEGSHVRLYRELAPPDKLKLRRALAECIRVYLRLASTG